MSLLLPYILSSNLSKLHHNLRWMEQWGNDQFEKPLKTQPQKYPEAQIEHLIKSPPS